MLRTFKLFISVMVITYTGRYLINNMLEMHKFNQKYPSQCTIRYIKSGKGRKVRIYRTIYGENNHQTTLLEVSNCIDVDDKIEQYRNKFDETRLYICDIDEDDNFELKSPVPDNPAMGHLPWIYLNLIMFAISFGVCTKILEKKKQIPSKGNDYKWLWY